MNDRSLPQDGAAAAPAPDALALSALLDRMGLEMSALARVTLRAEHAIARTLASGHRLPEGVSGDLQRIDLVRQSLEDLSRLLHVTAGAAPAGTGVARPAVENAARLVSLSSRLLDGTTPIGPPPFDQAEEDMTLF